MIEAAMKADLENLTKELFIEVYDGTLEGDERFLLNGVTVTINEDKSKFQPNTSSEFQMDFNNRACWYAVEITLTKGDRTITIISNTNYYTINGTKVKYKLGVNVYTIVETDTIAQYTWDSANVSGNPNNRPVGVNVDKGRLFVPMQAIRALG
jgi:hypothetical protein